MGFPGDSDRKESACSMGDTGLIPGLGREEGRYLEIPGEGNGNITVLVSGIQHNGASQVSLMVKNPLHYSCLENPMDRGIWQATYSPRGCKELGMTEATQHITT